MKTLLLTLCLFAIASNSYGQTDLKKEIKDLINSNITFYSKVERGMGVRGEIISDLFDEMGQYQNCTVAIRGKSFLINSTIDKNYYFHYQEHWVDINIKEGNNCDPDVYSKEHSRFVTMEQKGQPLTDLFSILDNQEELQIEKASDKIYVFKYTVVDNETGLEVPIVVTYNLNFPLYMNPDSSMFKNQRFDYDSLDLSAMPLCQPMEEGGECGEDQDLSYLLIN